MIKYRVHISFLNDFFFEVSVEFVIILFLFYVLAFLVMSHVGSWLPYQGWNLHSLHWKVKS